MQKRMSGYGSLVVKVMDSQPVCPEFEPGTTEDSWCRGEIDSDNSKMFLFVSCLIALLGEALFSQPANQYVDNVLYTSLQSVIRNEKLDPTHLPDYTFEYTDKTFLGKVRGKVEYKEGSLSGLAQVGRASECQGPTNTSSGTVIHCTLSFNYLQPSYKGKVKYGLLPKLSIKADAELSTTLVVIGILKSPHERQAKVKTFSLRQIGQLTTHFTGLGPLNILMYALEENYKKRVAAEVTNVIVNRFQYALNLAVSQIPMPLSQVPMSMRVHY
ncbi:uncharacterized protein TNCV_1009881 [Trichonephila clavipes]|nr:uncharacterized protein TNCV_1009881 [Trichonephila clavipes]